MSDKPLADALALVKFGPCKSAERPQDWVNVASPMCAHCLDCEDVNLAAARIITDAYQAIQSERDALHAAALTLILAKGRYNTMLAYKALEELVSRNSGSRSGEGNAIALAPPTLDSGLPKDVPGG